MVENSLVSAYEVKAKNYLKDGKEDDYLLTLCASSTEEAKYRFSKEFKNAPGCREGTLIIDYRTVKKSKGK